MCHRVVGPQYKFFFIILSLSLYVFVCNEVARQFLLFLDKKLFLESVTPPFASLFKNIPRKTKTKK